MIRRGLMSAALGLTLAAFAGLSGNAADTGANVACNCCGASCACAVCYCDEIDDAGPTCDCCGGSTCCTKAPSK